MFDDDEDAPRWQQPYIPVPCGHKIKFVMHLNPMQQDHLARVHLSVCAEYAKILDADDDGVGAVT